MPVFKPSSPIVLALAFLAAFTSVHHPPSWTLAATSEAFSEHIETLRAVGPEGKGNAEAKLAWQAITAEGGDAILPLLQAMEAAGPLSANWLRSALEVIVADQLEAGESLPSKELGAFVLDNQQDPRARRLAFELLDRIAPETAALLVPGMINDPSTELRRDAVAGVMEAAAKRKAENDTVAAQLLYRQALNAARDVDQIQAIAGELGKLGADIDLPSHFGFLMRWKTIGPFDNTERGGFAQTFPPEAGIDLDATYEGKEGEVSWQALESSDDYGMIDFNKPYGPLKEVVGYAYTEFQSDTDRAAEFRLGCKNAWKVWINGELIFGRDEYHRGMRIDQYKLPIQLRKGPNTILVKLCQNEQEEDWTVQWQFQARICDASGTAIHSPDRKPTPEPEAPAPRRPSEAN